jgi:cytochrome c oxidase assembly factor CtaG
MALVPGRVVDLALLAPSHAQDTGLTPLTWDSWFRTWAWEPVPALGVVLVAVLYLIGVGRLRARGDAWPVGRTLAFVVGGLGTIAVATQSFLAYYDTVLLSSHMVQHMLLSMVAPILLGLGAPITLLLRTAPAAVRRLVLSVLHSRWLRVVGHPVVAGSLFVINPWILYFTPLYELTLRHSWLHDLNHLHFLALGCLWFWSLVGVDPMPRASHPMRLVAVFLTLPFHAFLGVLMMGMNRIIASDWYAQHPRSWGPTFLQDQYMAGGILWITGDLLGVMVLAVLFVQWARASDREARRVDRELDRQDELDRVRSMPDAPAVESGP